MTYLKWKRRADLLIATLLLVVTSPIWALAALLLRLIQGRPVLYRQQRIGLYGKPFTLLKFRTMVDGKPLRLPDLPVAKAPDDPRVTPLGKFLRRFAIDELPQLWNVLRGEMSLVGPRPLPQEDLEQWGWLHQVGAEESARRADWASRRHGVLPGLTGRWQITALPEDDFENWIDSDFAYLERPTLWGDFLLVIRTPYALARGRKRAGMPYAAHVDERQSQGDAV